MRKQKPRGDGNVFTDDEIDVMERASDSRIASDDQPDSAKKV